LFIPDPDADFLSIPDPGVEKAPDPGSGSATLKGSFATFTFEHALEFFAILKTTSVCAQDLAERMSRQYLVLNREREDAFPLHFEDMMTGGTSTFRIKIIPMHTELEFLIGIFSRVFWA
jgi:hypothetical protein